MWVDRLGTGWAPLQWREPAGVHVEAAGKLVDKYLLAAAADLESAVCGGAGSADAVEHKQRCQALISGLSAILMGLMGRLEDFTGMPGAEAEGGGGAGGVPLYPVGRTGARVGRPGARNAAAAALARAIRCGAAPRGAGCARACTFLPSLAPDRPSSVCCARRRPPANWSTHFPSCRRPFQNPAASFATAATATCWSRPWRRRCC
jgi:hypothetical protein